MARTQGHGNPDWTRDETLLALNLYFALGGSAPSGKHPQVVELSDLLRAFPHHAEAARKPSFRNPDGVAFKLQNLRQVATGKGLPNTSETDRAIWAEFGQSPSEVARLAQAIRATLNAAPAVSVDDDVVEFREGRILTTAHLRRERNPKVRRHLLKKRRASNSLSCDMCGLQPRSQLPDFFDAEFEAHHLLPLAATTERATKMADLALLCANCHRLLHRAIAREKKWLGLDEARLLLMLPELH